MIKRTWIVKTFSVMALCFAVLVLSGCGKSEDAASAVSPEMKAFIGGFGSHQKVGEQLKLHGKEGLDTQDMEVWDLQEPEVIGIKNEGPKTCYDISTKAGITTRYFTVCWEGGKIVSVKDHVFTRPQQ
jgi:hypothetical protein